MDAPLTVFSTILHGQYIPKVKSTCDAKHLLKEANTLKQTFEAIKNREIAEVCLAQEAVKAAQEALLRAEMKAESAERQLFDALLHQERIQDLIIKSGFKLPPSKCSSPPVVNALISFTGVRYTISDSKFSDEEVELILD